MKTITLITALFISFCSIFAQEGHIIYDIQLESDQPEVQAQIGMLAGSTLEVFYQDAKSKTVSSMGSLITTTTISDADTGETLLLMSGMMGKLASKSNANDEEEKEEEPEITVELMDETKEILGYTCKKAILTSEDGTEMEYWYTEELERGTIKAQGFSDKIPGVPLAFTVATPQMKMVYTAKEVSTKIKKAKKVFDMEIPEGYAEKTKEEMKNMMGGGQ